MAMNTSIFVLPLLLGLGQLASPALAQELAVPDKEHLKGMSYEEYSNYREKMRKRMEKTGLQERQLMQEAEKQDQDSRKKSAHSSTYGQGYGSRNNAAEVKPDTKPESRADRPQVPDRPQLPERPQLDRFDRSSMGRR
jgi:hypothetical protein